MKKFNFFLTTLFTAVMLMGSTSAWGETVNYAMSSLGLANSTVTGTNSYTVDDVISISFAQNSSGTAPTYYTSGNAVRLYQNATKGGSIIISVTNGYKITDVTVTRDSSGDGPAGYLVDDGPEAGTFGDGTIDNVISGVNATSYVEYYSKGTSKTERAYIVSISVTYVSTSSPCTPADYLFDSNNVSKSTTDAPFTNDFISDNTSPVVWSSSNTDVATVDAGTGEVTIVGAGTAEIEITQVADDTYCAVNASYTLNVVSTTPTITVSPASLSFSGIVVGGTPGEDLVEVTGANLTENITAVISGDNAAMFTIDETTITVTDGAASATPIITYTPLAAGTHTATLTLSSAGADDKTVTLTGTATLPPLGVPVATAATGINSSGFTATWEAVSEADSYELSVYTKEGGGTTSVDFGFEGDSNILPTDWSGDGYVQNTAANANSGSRYAGLNAANKYIQTNSIDNITNLSFYYRYSGATANNTVKVQSSANGTDWVDEADYTATGSGASTTYAQVTLPISTGSKYIKWIMTARSGGSFYFDDVTIVSGSETITPVTGYEALSVSGTSQNVTGLTNAKLYYYTVKAVRGAEKSVASNEVGPIELTTTNVNNTAALSGIAIHNGNLMVPATAGTLIEVYNIAGQKIVSQTAKEGVNTIAIAQRGAMIVKIGTETVKVVF